MINGKNYYQILGLLPDAEDIVIRAAYRTLSQKYHPDKWSGDPKVATEKMSELNAAYDVLSDPARRAQYDEELRRSGCDKEFESDHSVDDDFSESFSQFEEDWNYATEFFPDLAKYLNLLKKLNLGLAFAYQQTLLERKSFKQGEKIFADLKRSFLSRYFSDDENLQAFAEELLSKNYRNAALELNKAIRILGDQVPRSKLINRVYAKFPECRPNRQDLDAHAQSLTKFQNAFRLSTSIIDYIEALSYLGADVVTRGFLDKRFTVEFYTQIYDFNRDELIEFAIAKVESELREIEALRSK